MAEVCVFDKSKAPHLSYNACESRENLCEFCMKVKTLLSEVLSELRATKGSIEILQKEIRKTKEGGLR
jgi:hypothetical protein